MLEGAECYDYSTIDEIHEKIGKELKKEEHLRVLAQLKKYSADKSGIIKSTKVLHVKFTEIRHDIIPSINSTFEFFGRIKYVISGILQFL